MKNIIYIIAVTALIVSCNNVGQNSTDETERIQTQDKNEGAEYDNFPSPNPIEGNFLTYNDWKVNGIVTKDEKRKEMYRNVRFEIRRDGLFYVYNENNEEVVHGVFMYDPGESKIKFYPRENDQGWKLSEWEVQYNGSAMVMTGTGTNSDNGLSMRLNKVQNEQ